MLQLRDRVFSLVFPLEFSGFKLALSTRSQSRHCLVRVACKFQHSRKLKTVKRRSRRCPVSMFRIQVSHTI